LQSYVAQHVLDTWKSTSMQFIMHASYYIIWLVKTNDTHIDVILITLMITWIIIFQQPK
jgi:hypothetical protein